MHRTILPSFASRRNRQANKPAATNEPGPMPEWDLSDLYPGAGCSEACKRDLKKAARGGAADQGRYQGRLADLAGDGASWPRPSRTYEKLSDPSASSAPTPGCSTCRTDRSGAGEVQWRHLGEDHQDHTDLIFFELELNQIDEETIGRGWQVPELERYKPWLDDLRKDKPHQLDEQLERFSRKVDHRARRLDPALQRNDDGACGSRWKARRSRCRSSRR